MNTMVKRFTAILLFCISVFSLKAQIQDSSNIFQVKDPDFTRSPFTGVTRKHWKDAALYLLSGAFGYIHTLDDPMKFPKQPGKSYPKNEGQVPTEKLEGLCRTLFLAAPLLKEDSSLSIHGIKVADYYRHQLLQLINASSESFIAPRAKNGGPSQKLVEFGALAVSLFIIPEILWEPLPQDRKDLLAKTMISYGDGPTVPSNWKFFNIFVLSFFKDQGYPVNEKLLEEYLQKSLQHYRGEGWYNDNPAYDYYSMWAFQMYGIIWSEYFGKKHYPKYAGKFLDNSRELKNNYPYLFSRNGEMIMWGRSITYRIGSIVPFPLLGFTNDPLVNHGWTRRISSGVLLQFLRNPQLLEDGVPTLGFYGAFEPAVQSYSCRGSVYWMGKAFLGLLVPENNSFWTAVENEGPWEKEMTADKVYHKFQKGSDILITDYPAIGAAEIRAWCKVPVIGAGEPFRGSENYNRLSYNSAFPWQADGPNGEVAMNYVIRNKKGEWEPWRIYSFKKYDSSGIYYRDVHLETDSTIGMNLADIPLPNGILRVDRINSKKEFDARMGHYALPELNAPIVRQKWRVKGGEAQVMSNGVYELAVVTLKGWDKTELVESKGLHPVSEKSAVWNLTDHFKPEAEQQFYVALLLWKKSGTKWKKKEWMPVRSINYTKNTVEISFSNGDKKTVVFE